MQAARSVITRFFTFGAILATLTAALVLAWRLGHPPMPAPPLSQRAPGLPSPSQITWGESGDAHIEAADDLAAAGGVGFVHAWNHAWTMHLWRQAALGRLAEWFGAKALAADALAHRLGLTQYAKESLALLNSEDRALLASYAAGASAALAHRSISLRPEFLVLGQAPEPWLAWHSLAVERLIAYLSSELECTDAAQYCAADSTLRALLHVHGFDRSAAWVVRQDSAARMFQRHVYGSTALPVFQEVVLNLHQSPWVRGITLIGTPFFVGGQSPHHSWAVLLDSPVALRNIRWSFTTSNYVRLKDASSTEHVVHISRTAGTVHVGTSSDSTAWVLSWPGLASGSDIAAWRALAGGQDADFGLFTGTRLLAGTDGRWRIVGTPAIVKESPVGVMISRDPWAEHQPEPAVSWLDTPQWVTGTYSAYAAAVVPGLLEVLNAERPDRPSAINQALIYLRNWDFNYSRMSIGASIFSTWLDSFEKAAGGHFAAVPHNADLLQSSLMTALRTLAMEFGENQDDWQWEQVQPDNRHYAIAHLPDAAEMPRFAPLAWPGQSQAIESRWSAPSGSAGFPASATVELWHDAHWPGSMVIRQRHAPASGAFGRHRLRSYEIPVYGLPSPAAHTTLLTP